jgi:dynein heavy chain
VARENVLLLVHDYNEILSIMTDDERALFHDRIYSMDKKIGPALSKLTWTSRGVVEFALECRRTCRDVMEACSLSLSRH